MSGIIGTVGSKSGVIGTTELDYEEGTFMTAGADGTGSWTTGSYEMNTVIIMAKYIKVGKKVTCWFETTGKYTNSGLANGVDGLYAKDGTCPFTPSSLYTNDGPTCGNLTVAGNTFGQHGTPVFVNASGQIRTVGNSMVGTYNVDRKISGWFTYMTD